MKMNRICRKYARKNDGTAAMTLVAPSTTPLDTARRRRSAAVIPTSTPTNSENTATPARRAKLRTVASAITVPSGSWYCVSIVGTNSSPLRRIEGPIPGASVNG